jgi:hypothetical protein
MVYLHTKNPNSGIFEDLGTKHFYYRHFTANWNIFLPFGILCYGHLVYVMDIWYMLWTFGICYGHLIYVCYGLLVYFVVIWLDPTAFGMLYR